MPCSGSPTHLFSWLSFSLVNYPSVFKFIDLVDFTDGPSEGILPLSPFSFSCICICLIVVSSLPKLRIPHTCHPRFPLAPAACQPQLCRPPGPRVLEPVSLARQGLCVTLLVGFSLPPCCVPCVLIDYLTPFWTAETEAQSSQAGGTPALLCVGSVQGWVPLTGV